MNKKSALFCLGAAALMLQACGGGGDTVSPPPVPAPTPAPAAAPTVSLDTTTAAARVGDKVTLTWNSQNATACTASGAWSGARAISGSEVVSLAAAGPSAYTLTCTGAGGNGAVTKNVTVAPAMTQIVIPGAPAPLAVAKGNCVSTSDADYEVHCIDSAASIPSRYDVFTSSLSGRVVASVSTPASVTLGGACTAGFDRLQNRLSIDTTLVDHAFPITGSTVSEVTYKPSLLSSLSQGAITEMSVLFFQDNSNTDRMGYVLYGVVSGEPVVIVGAGTISSDGAFDIVDCIDDGGVTTPPPPPPPPPTALSCPERHGPGTNGLGFIGTTSYDISNTASGQTTPRSMGWGVRYNNPNRASTAYTGSLRITLWAVSQAYSGGDISGYKAFSGSPSFVGAGAKSANQIYNFYTVSDITTNGTGRNPPAGKYCMVASLDEYSDSCSSTDHFCTVDWVQFAGTESFP